VAGRRRTDRYDRGVSAPAPDRIRVLLLRADNLLKNTVPGGDPHDRVRRARAALQEAAGVAADADVDPRLRDLVSRRLDSLAAMEGADGGLA
jgi:hypothetical protein